MITFLIILGIFLLFGLVMGAAMEEDTISIKLHYHKSRVKTKCKDLFLERYQKGEIGITTQEFKTVNGSEYVKVKFENKTLFVIIHDLEWIEYY